MLHLASTTQEGGQIVQPRRLGKVDHAAVEVARAARFFDAVLIARRERDRVVPSYRRERVRGLLSDLVA